MMSEYMSSAIDRAGDSSISSDQSQEDSWIAESQRGNAQAFNRLVLKWEKSIYNLAFRMLRNREEAAEATQDVFLLAFKNIRQFRLGSRLSTWLFRIALNHCITRLRHRPPGIHLSLDDDSAAAHPANQLAVSGSQHGELLQLEQRRKVLKALSHLLPEQQAVIELKFYQDRTFEEIAEILATPLSTIKSRLYSGLEMLKVRLGSQD
jgi:RNA polymerase sigma-70 factor (ECF subfamily)